MTVIDADALILNDDETARNISINAMGGAFRFMSGKSPKNSHSSTTSTATIGVRG